jgi:hypothetical protein
VVAQVLRPRSKSQPSRKRPEPKGDGALGGCRGILTERSVDPELTPSYFEGIKGVNNMRTFTKISAVAVAAAALVSFSAPANAAIYIGLQQAGVNGGAITQVATGANGASYMASYGNFQMTLTTGLQGVLPVLLESTAVAQTSSASGGTLDVYVTRDGITDFASSMGFRSAFSTTALTPGWTLTSRTYYNSNNSIFGTSNLISTLNGVPGAGFSESQYTPALVAGPYSVTERYTIVASSAGQSNSGISIAVVPEPGTWALMIMGFGGAGAMLRSRRRSNALTA